MALHQLADDLSVTWHALSAEEVLERLETPEQQDFRQLKLNGVSLNTVQTNWMKNHARHFFSLCLNQLIEFCHYPLDSGNVISAILGEYVDAAAIIGIVILNAVLGVIQESKAEEALCSVKKRCSAPESHVA
jgi:Ca2+-transporting ATPase